MAFEQEKELLSEYEKRQQEFDPSYIIQKDNKVIIGNQIALSIKLGDNLIVLEDKYKDPNFCDQCQDTKKIKTTCDKCGGRGKNRFEFDCPDCEGKGYIFLVCNACRNKIVIPEQARARPTSGIIVAVGPKVKYRFHLFGWHFWKRKNGYEIDDRVAYSGYTGHLIPFKGNTRLRIMREHEPFCLVENITDSNSTTVEFIDKDTAYDLT